MADILLQTRKNGVTTLTMNTPKQLNGWTGPMMLSIMESLSNLGKDPDTKAAILTGTGPYYCAGVNLSSYIQVIHPQKLHIHK
jgi:peroxisomal 3,2-trans-enoyl-CoA isomerase